MKKRTWNWKTHTGTLPGLHPRRTRSPHVSNSDSTEHNLRRWKLSENASKHASKHSRICRTTTPEEPFYARALSELQEIEETMELAVSDID
ncbi:hypothetical protein TNCT_310011 [Trichonephila clavata]|uniref:Uncharacterized protein n=1 Tax=Trichonephila clavata TaxID=2740835 RepID=A0A8X6KKF7_TRICU|nr:hypothetical protein TNCT_310011 [Trichonephila clavata]